MKHPYHKNALLKLAAVILLVITVVIIHSCRKDNKQPGTLPTDIAVAKAKAWYESAYPAGTTNQKTTQGTNSITSTKFDFSKHIKPNWQHAASYVRFSKNVIEMPIDSTGNFGYDLKNMTVNQAYSDKKYNRTYFLLLNDGQNYEGTS